MGVCTGSLNEVDVILACHNGGVSKVWAFRDNCWRAMEKS